MPCPGELSLGRLVLHGLAQHPDKRRVVFRGRAGAGRGCGIPLAVAVTPVRLELAVVVLDRLDIVVGKDDAALARSSPGPGPPGLSLGPELGCAHMSNATAATIPSSSTGLGIRVSSCVGRAPVAQNPRRVAAAPDRTEVALAAELDLHATYMYPQLMCLEMPGATCSTFWTEAPIRIASKAPDAEAEGGEGEAAWTLAAAARAAVAGGAGGAARPHDTFSRLELVQCSAPASK